jgi:hypothetical protein
LPSRTRAGTPTSAQIKLSRCRQNPPLIAPLAPPVRPGPTPQSRVIYCVHE